MKIDIQRADERGKGEHGWLHARHSFSFASYYNPKRMNFGTLRVLNQDIVEPGRGFGEHPHDNMEIVTIVLEGALEHKDNTGGHGVIKPGDVQVMSAGSGVVHSEFNHSKTDRVHLLQIWVDTKEQDIKPRYDQKKFAFPKDKLVVVASGKKNEGLYIHQDAYFNRGLFEKGKTIKYKLNGKENGVYLFVIAGNVEIDSKVLKKSDAAAITDAKEIEIKVLDDSDILAIEVPME